MPEHCGRCEHHDRNGGGVTTGRCKRPVVAVTYQHNFIMLGPIMSLINRTWSNQINVYGDVADATRTAAGS